MDNTKNLFSQNLIQKADELYQKGQCDAAVDLLLAGIKQFSDEKRLYYALADFLIDSEQFKDALDILNRLPIVSGTGKGAKEGEKNSSGSRMEKQDVRRLELIGYCQAGLGKYEAAAVQVDKVLCVQADSALAHNLKGLLAIQKGDKAIAEKLFKKAIDLDPDYGEPQTNLGNLRWADARYSAAIDFYENGFTLSPTTKDIVLAYHSAVNQQKAFERAERKFQEAIALYPQNRRLRYLLIDVLLKQSKHAAAMRQIQWAMITYGIDDGILQAALTVREQLDSTEIEPKSEKGNTVSLCMIAKNEEQDIARCLWSAQPVVDEMIVVDTGSSDRTKNIAEVFGAKVFDYKWEDDFSKARNFSISKASADWIVILDADEIISSRDYDGFKDLIKKPSNNLQAYSIVTRNYTMHANTVGWVAHDGHYGADEAGSGWFPSEKVRLFPNDDRIKFEYPVHEIVEPCLKKLGIQVKKCDLAVLHYGKLNEEKSYIKTETYYQLGQEKLTELNGNVAAIRELAVQAGHLEKHADAIDLWQRFIALAPDSPEAYVNMGTAYWHLGKYEDAVSQAQKAMTLAPNLKEAQFNYAISELPLGNAHKAVEVLENLVSRHPQYLAAQFMLAAAYCCDGKKAKAMSGFQKIGRTQLGPVLAVTFNDLAKRLAAADRIDYAIALLETTIEGKHVNDDVRNLLNSYRQKAMRN